MTGQEARDEAARRYPYWEQPEPGDPEPDYSEIDAKWQNADADDRRAAFVAGWEAALARKHPEPEITEKTVFDVVRYDDDGEKVEATWITMAEAAAYITGRTVSLTSPIYFAGWGVRERQVPVSDSVSGEGEQ